VFDLDNLKYITHRTYVFVRVQRALIFVNLCQFVTHIKIYYQYTLKDSDFWGFERFLGKLL